LDENSGRIPSELRAWAASTSPLSWTRVDAVVIEGVSSSTATVAAAAAVVLVVVVVVVVDAACAALSEGASAVEDWVVEDGVEVPSDGSGTVGKMAGMVEEIVAAVVASSWLDEPIPSTDDEEVAAAGSCWFSLGVGGAEAGVGGLLSPLPLPPPRGNGRLAAGLNLPPFFSCPGLQMRVPPTTSGLESQMVHKAACSSPHITSQSR